jgi:hypothetical protein
MAHRPASPFRLADTPLIAQERVLEQELAGARHMLDAFSNEEVRIERKALVGQATKAEVAAITRTVEQLIVTVDRLSYQLASVRTEIHWRGERRWAAANPVDDDDGPLWPLWLGAVLFAFVVAAGMWGSS